MAMITIYMAKELKEKLDKLTPDQINKSKICCKALQDEITKLE